MFYDLGRNKIDRDDVSRGVHAPFQQIVVSAIRAGVLVALAMLLILGLLPAILAAEAGLP
jgi:formate/nitrite transporter FocA (FNT family)